MVAAPTSFGSTKALTADPVCITLPMAPGSGTPRTCAQSAEGLSLSHEALGMLR